MVIFLNNPKILLKQNAQIHEKFHSSFSSLAFEFLSLTLKFLKQKHLLLSVSDANITKIIPFKVQLTLCWVKTFEFCDLGSSISIMKSNLKRRICVTWIFADFLWISQTVFDSYFLLLQKWQRYHYFKIIKKLFLFSLYKHPAKLIWLSRILLFLFDLLYTLCEAN